MSNEPESTGERFARSVVELGRQWRGERFSSVRVWPSALTEREAQDAAALLGEIEAIEATSGRAMINLSEFEMIAVMRLGMTIPDFPRRRYMGADFDAGVPGAFLTWDEVVECIPLAEARVKALYGDAAPPPQSEVGQLLAKCRGESTPAKESTR